MISAYNSFPIGSTSMTAEVEKLRLTEFQQSQSSQDKTGIKIEQLLWKEMLVQSGLEKALTLNGGEAVSAFSSMAIQSISEELSARYSLGIADGIAAVKAGEVGQAEFSKEIANEAKS